MPLKSSTRWKPEDDKRLLELIAGGMTPMRAANVLRRSLGSIETRLTVLRARAALGANVPTTSTYARWTEEDDRRLIALRDAGRPAFLIATSLDRTLSAVTSRLYVLRRGPPKIKGRSNLASKADQKVTTRKTNW